jgi:cell wall-associated NlpC family hydrolase
LVPALAIALGAAFISLPGAQAEPAVTVQDVEAAFHQAEAMNEQVNQLGEDIKKTSKQIDDLSAEIATQTAVFEQQREALGASIVQQQMNSPLGTTASLLGSGDPEAFINGLGAVQALNSSRTDALDSFSEVSAQLDNRKAQLADRRASMKADKKDAAKKQEKIQAKYREAKAELARLTAAQQTAFNSSDIDVDFEIPAGGRAKAAINFALAQLGDPYVYGGTGPNGWDCSGLVMKAYAAAGVSLPRVVGPQMSAVRRVSMSDLRPGDIVAYGDMSHDGIYLGKGRVVHAPRPGKSVEITGLGGYSVAGRVG